MFDPISLALTGGSALLGLIQGQQQKKASAEALAMQKAMADEQLRFAKAARTDAYGNKVYYDETTGEWRTALDPYQDRLIKAGEHEQLLSLTQDAARNRAVHEREFARGGQAGDDYARTRAQYLYGSQPSEGAIEGQLAKLLSLARRPSGTTNANQQLRTSGNLPVVSSGGGGDEDTGVNQLAKTLAQARSGALSEFGQRGSARNARFLPALSAFGKTAGGGTGGAPKYSDTPDDLRKTADTAAKGVASAQSGSAKNIGTAYNHYATAVGKQFPDLSKLGTAFSKGNASKADDDPYQRASTTGPKPGYYGGSPETNEWLNPNYYSGYGVG